MDLLTHSWTYSLTHDVGNYYPSTKEEWPVIMKAVIDGYHDKSTSSVLMAIGGALWQLKRSLIDNEVFSLGKVMV